MKIINVGKRKICIGGIGKFYFQDGMPIDITADLLREKGIEISWYHVIEELIKNDWDVNRIMQTLEPILTTGKNYIEYDNCREFIYASYKEKKKIIFQYLFQDKEKAKNWLRCNL